MTGQTGDPKSLNSPEQAPRTRIFRKSRVRKWEISQIRRPPIWHILDISRISRISQKSLLFHRQTPVRTPFPVRSGKIPDLSCQISSTQQISSLFPGFPKNQLVRTRYFDTFPENRRNIDRQRALWHTFSRIWQDLTGSGRSARLAQNSRFPENPKISQNPRSDLARMTRSADLPSRRFPKFPKISDFPEISEISEMCTFPENPRFPEFRKFPNFQTISEISDFPDFPNLQICHATHSSHMPHIAHRCHWLLALNQQRASSASHLPS